MIATFKNRDKRKQISCYYVPIWQLNKLFLYVQLYVQYYVHVVLKSFLSHLEHRYISSVLSLLSSWRIDIVKTLKSENSKIWLMEYSISKHWLFKWLYCFWQFFIVLRLYWKPFSEKGKIFWVKSKRLKIKSNIFSSFPDLGIIFPFFLSLSLLFGVQRRESQRFIERYLSIFPWKGCFSFFWCLFRYMPHLLIGYSWLRVIWKILTGVYTI